MTFVCQQDLASCSGIILAFPSHLISSHSVTSLRSPSQASFCPHRYLCKVVCLSGEGNGTPLQCSCLENPMDRGAWQATVHEVAKSWTGLSDFTFTFFHFCCLQQLSSSSSSSSISILKLEIQHSIHTKSNVESNCHNFLLGKNS